MYYVHVVNQLLGKIDFDLHKMPVPAKTKRRCRLSLLDQGRNQKLVLEMIMI